MTTASSQASRSPTACVWCGADLGDGEQLGGRIRCRACGVATTDPWPTQAELDTAYAGAYRPDSGRFAGPGDRLLRATRGRLARRIDRISPPGPVLDVGAGDGALLEALRRRGRVAEGLEREGDGRAGVRAGDVADEPPGHWAAIVFWHSLEHLPAPGAAIDAAARALLPSGVLIVAIPNAASLQARLFGRRWLAIDAPRHLAHITAAALLARLHADGMTLLRTGQLRGGQVVFGWLAGLVGSLPGHPDLYDAIRRPAARSRRLTDAHRATILALGAALLPVALLATAVEVLTKRAGTVYVEARRA
jgi:SAM-dependent methyltransferase